MNTTVKRILGEANFHSPEEREQLSGATSRGERSDTPEERRDIVMAKEILAAAQAGNKAQAIRSAQELIRVLKEEPATPGLQIGTISTKDFLLGEPFLGAARNRYQKRRGPVPGMKPLE